MHRDSKAIPCGKEKLLPKPSPNPNTHRLLDTHNDIPTIAHSVLRHYNTKGKCSSSDLSSVDDQLIQSRHTERCNAVGGVSEADC